MLDLLLPKPGEGIGSEIAVGKLYASILIQDCFRRFVLKQILVHFLHFFDLMYLLLISLKKIIVFLLKHTLEIYFVRHFSSFLQVLYPSLKWILLKGAHETEEQMFEE